MRVALVLLTVAILVVVAFAAKKNPDSCESVTARCRAACKRITADDAHFQLCIEKFCSACVKQNEQGLSEAAVFQARKKGSSGGGGGSYCIFDPMSFVWRCY